MTTPNRPCTAPRPRVSLTLCLALLAAATSLPRAAPAATRSWLSAADGSWSDSNNWSGAAVPGASDNVFITNDGSFVVSVNAGATFATLLLGGPSATQTLAWSSGTLSGSMTVGSHGLLDLASVADKYLAGTITNEGTITWSTGAWYWSTARLDNRPGGLVDLRVNGTISSSGGSHVFTNAGTLRKSVNPGLSALALQIQFINAGDVDIQTGTFQFAGGFTSSGTFSVPTNAALELRGGTFTFQPGHAITGDGYYGVPNGTVTLLGPIAQPRFRFDGGTLSHTGEITGKLLWSAGTLASGARIATGGELELLGVGDKYLYGATTNEGTIAWTAGAWYWNHVRIANEPGGLVDVATDTAFASAGGTHVVENQGTFRKSAGSGLTSFAGVMFSFLNQGKVEARRGVLQLPASYAETPTSSLGVSIGGTNAGSQYGRVAFTVGPAFAGRFAVLQDGFTPSPGDTFKVMTYASPTGDVVAVDGLDLGTGLRLEPRFGPTDLTLLTVQLPTYDPPRVSAYPSLRALLLVWPIEFAGWKPITETNMLATNWPTLQPAGTNSTVVALDEPVRFYGLVEPE